MTTNQHGQSISPLATEADATPRSSDLRAIASGSAAIVGGCLAVAAALLLSLEPAGCIAAECDTRPMRTTPPGIAAMSVVATVLITVALAGLASLAPRSGSERRLARAGQICGVSGVAVLFAAVFAQSTVFGGDLPLMPVVVGVGALLILAGLALLVVLLWNTRAVPRWLTVALGVCCALLVALNDQTAAILFLTPFAMTVVAIGVFLVTARRSRPRRMRR